jgi:hypothetical protein
MIYDAVYMVESIARYACEHDRVILTQADDFFTELDIETAAGVLFQRDQTLSTREVGDAVHEMSRYPAQSDVALEYVSRNWLCGTQQTCGSPPKTMRGPIRSPYRT